MQVVAANDYTIIQGLPGTGKTFTIAFLIQLLVGMGKRVLITSYTHSAVDNVVMKLLDEGVGTTDRYNPYPAIVRVGRTGSCHPDVQALLADRVAASFTPSTDDEPASELPSVDALRDVISRARIVGVTTLSVPRSPLLMGEDLDVVVVDEAAQISQPAILGALVTARSFVLVGDHMQLPPLVASEAAEQGGKRKRRDGGNAFTCLSLF